MEAVGQRLEELRARRRDRVRWQMSAHTAEMAIAAFRSGVGYRPSAKSRRRKRYKRLL